MKPFAVIGASSGTGLALVKLLEKNGYPVRAISRTPPPASEFIEPYSADVTNPDSIAKALAGDFSTVFFTVDIHGFNSRAKVRELMYQGFIHTIEAAAKNKIPPKIVLLSVIGSEIPSWVWWILNAIKPGMQKNIIDREKALRDSGLTYVICRAPKLNDQSENTTSLVATAPKHKLSMKMTISRQSLASALLKASTSAPDNSIWDICPGLGEDSSDWL